MKNEICNLCIIQSHIEKPYVLLLLNKTIIFSIDIYTKQQYLAMDEKKCTTMHLIGSGIEQKIQ